MARAMLGGLLEKGYPPEQLNVVDPNEDIRQKLNQDFGVSAHKKANTKCLSADYLILAIKPQILLVVCDELATHWPSSEVDTKIISIAAGIRSSTIAQRLHSITTQQHTVIRAMPNTPALLGLGASGLFSQQVIDPESKTAIEDIFSTIGISIWVDTETQLDTVTALSGSGPAYFFQMIESLIAAGVAEGLSPDQAQQLVIQTALGAAHMAKQTTINESRQSVSDLRKSVTSKGGTTEAGLASLQADQFAEIIKHAIHKAKSRSIELSDEFGK